MDNGVEAHTEDNQQLQQAQRKKKKGGMKLKKELKNQQHRNGPELNTHGQQWRWVILFLCLAEN